MTSSRYIIGGLLIVFGISFFLGFPILKLLIALVLVGLGIRVIFGFTQDKMAMLDGNSLNEVAILSPFTKKAHSSAFRGGKVVLIFAGGELDLSEVTLEHPTTTLELVVIFGGLKLIVPKQWLVRTEGTAILGGYTNEARAAEGMQPTTLTLTGVLVCSGVDVVYT